MIKLVTENGYTSINIICIT